MKKRNILTAIVLSAVLGVVSFTSYAMGPEGDEKKAAANTVASVVHIAAASAAIEEPQVSPAREEDMMLVHLTKYCPRDNIMIPGSVPLTQILSRTVNDAENLAIAKLFPPTRATLHWTLNGTMFDHEFTDGGTRKILSRRSYPYAVIVPLTEVKHQIIGGTREDVFAIGPVKLNKTSFIIMPKGDLIDQRAMESQIVYYDPSQEEIDNVVSKLLQQLNKPVITEVPDQKVEITLDTIEGQDPEYVLKRYVYPLGKDVNEAFLNMKRQIRSQGGKFSSIDLEAGKISVNGVQVSEMLYLQNFFSQNHWESCFHKHSTIGKLDLVILPTVFSFVRGAILASEFDVELNPYAEIMDSMRRVGQPYLQPMPAVYTTLIKDVESHFSALKAGLSRQGASAFVQEAVERWLRDIKIWITYTVKMDIKSIEQTGKSFLDVSTTEARKKFKEHVRRIIATIKKDKESKATAASAASAASAQV